MAGYLHPDVLDGGLSVLDTATTPALNICKTQLPATRTEAITTYSVGSKASHSIGSPEAGGTGRKVVVAAVSGGSVVCTGTETAAYWAITDATRLLAAGPLAAPQSVTNGNTFSLAAFDITFPIPA
jgi:hypothetical protein